MFEELDTGAPRRRELPQQSEVWKGLVFGVGFCVVYFVVQIVTTEYHIWRTKQEVRAAGQEIQRAFKLR
jgi:hypothetical protein